MRSYVKKAAPPPPRDKAAVEETVRRMLADIDENRDEAVRRYARELDDWEAPDFRVAEDDIAGAARAMPETFKEDFAYCMRQVTEFARRQRDSLRDLEVELEPGILLGQKHMAAEKVGCYVPGGKYPLVSAAIMSVGTARAAGVGHVVGCAPPRDADGIFPPTLYALHAAGADEIYVLGGVQAMASMAYGCVGMSAVDLITGPGNPFVAEAKRQLFGVVGIDLLAGPTEICIIADDTADAALVATDLLGQAEHGPDSPAWLITTSRALGEAVLDAVEKQLETLPTAEIAAVSWRHLGEIVVVADADEAIALSDEYAPEHLELMTADDDYYLARLRNYGSLFVGEESTVAYGDKGVGTNHTLPTGGAARYTGGLWVGKFIKTVTYQRLTREASHRIAPIMSRMCAVEGMLAHQITADVRAERYGRDNVAPATSESTSESTGESTGESAHGGIHGGMKHIEATLRRIAEGPRLRRDRLGRRPRLDTQTQWTGHDFREEVMKPKTMMTGITGSSRRRFMQGAAAGTAALAFAPAFVMSPQRARAATIDNVHTEAAAAAKKLAAGRQVTLKILQPSGSLGNVKPVADRFTAETGVQVEYIEVPLGEITQKILLESVAKTGAFDLALPATFGIPDLVESGILVNLDQYALKYEPEGFQDDALYAIGDYYKGSLYGYQTDGDTYLMFYNKDWLENSEENKKFSDKHGYALKVPDTWEELDAMMAHFHRPGEGMYGGALFRTQYFLAWEWWVRFHAKGFYPLDDDLNPQINNEAGVKALEELIAASANLYPGAKTNGLFENFEAFGEGDKFCNIGWGGTQKFLNSDKSKIKGRLAFGNAPGGIVNGKLIKTPYFNWGWNYVVSSVSDEPEIAYLLSLYAASPAMSTIAVRDPGGYFDPFRGAHYKDAEIEKTYTKDFLVAHEASMRDSIPDLYLKGQGEYFDELRVNLQAADVRTKTPKEALDDTADAWKRITRRMGKRSQKVQWTFLKSQYPAGIRDILS